MADAKKEQTINLEDRLNNFEQWVNDNKKMLTIVGVVLFVIVGGYFGFTKLYLEPKSKEANDQIFQAQQYFGKDSLDRALNGDGNNLGFLQIIDDYKWTNAANLAEYYSGIILLKQEKFQDALDHLKKFNGKDKFVTQMALNAMGDASSELGKMDDAVDYYKKAAYHFENDLMTPVLLKKAGMLLENQKKSAEAKKIYQEVKDKYPNSNEGREMDKYIARCANS